MTEERDDIVVLIDENGEEVEFEHLDTIEMNDSEYVVLLPVDGDNEDPEADEVVILKLDHGSEEEDSFITIDDEDELNAVFEEFKQRLEEEYDEEE